MNGKIKKHNLKYLLNFVIELCRASTKDSLLQNVGAIH
jgi:hypothetical protein